jgi:hypothetical protein
MEYSSSEHACGFERSQLYSDGGPPVGTVAPKFMAPGRPSQVTAECMIIGAASRRGCGESAP